VQKHNINKRLYCS